MRSTTGDATGRGRHPGAVRFQLLGPVAAVDAEDRPLPLGRPRNRALLAALVVHAGRVLTVAQLVELLWDGSPPATAPTMVHGAVAGLRAALDLGAGGGPPLPLARRDGGYVLTVTHEQTDVGRFTQLVGLARPQLTAAPERAARLLAEALALWRGPALQGIEAAFAREAADRWEELRLEALELRMATELAIGHHSEVLAELQELAHRHPFRERLWEHLVLAQYRCGRQADALQSLHALRRSLASELGVDPGPRAQRLERAVLQQSPALEPARPRQVGPPQPALPSPYSSFVGRRHDLEGISALRERHRLVTLTGPGGSGKSRLAAEVARRLVDSGGEDVQFIDLARLTAPALVGETVAQALGIRAASGSGAAEAIAAALSGRDVTVVLDNCEHLVEPTAALVEFLLGAAPGLRVLVTSRAALRIPGEAVHGVGPLGTAGPEDAWDDIAACESVRLFTDRAAAASPGFAVTPANATLVLEVCRRLDGLPLALELAAARAASLPLAVLAERLDDRFRLLDPEDGPRSDRHRGLAAMLRWSYELLGVPERLLFTRLSVFPAMFSLSSAEAVVADGELPRRDIALRLGRLVAASAVQAEDRGEGPPRYRLLETTREFARERLTSRALADLRRRHAGYVLGLARAAEPHLLGPSSPGWLQQLRAAGDDVRAVLQWAFGEGGDPRLGAHLVAVLWHPWDLGGAREEGLHWVRAGLAAVSPDQPELRLPLLSAGALFHLGRGQFDAVTALTGELLPLARRTGAAGWAADALRLEGTVAWARGASDRAQHRYEDAVTTALAGGELWRAAVAEAQLARLHRDRDEPDAARATAVRALAHADDVGEGLACGLAVDVLASVEGRWGDQALAQRLAGDALARYRSVGYSEGEASALHLSGRLALAAHDVPRARTAFDAALALYQRIGHPAGVTAVRADLGRVAGG